MKIFLGKMAPGFVSSLIIITLGLYINTIREKILIKKGILIV